MPINSLKVVDIARQAGAQIMEIYQRDFETYTKVDESLLTDADLSAHHAILTAQLNLGGLPPSWIVYTGACLQDYYSAYGTSEK